MHVNKGVTIVLQFIRTCTERTPSFSGQLSQKCPLNTGFTKYVASHCTESAKSR